MNVENFEKLVAIFDGDADAAASCESLIQLAMMVNAAPLERAVQHLRQAHVVGPVVDPTAYRESVQRGRLQHNQACFGALLDFVHQVQASAARVAERNAELEARRDPRTPVSQPT
jgi:hypothetical protein